MTIQIKHPFVSAKGDGGDATLVRPSNWNAVHSTSMATGQLIGRLTAGVGAFEEIPISAYMASLLSATDAAALGGLLGLWTTGDVKYTLAAAVAPAGWISLSQAGSSNGLTIGNAASAGNIRASGDTQALFVMIYTNCSDAIAPVSGGRTGNALNDYNANKTITIPQLGGRSPMAAGAAGTGTSARTLGQVYGEESHILITGEIPSHQHNVFLKDPGHFHSGALNTGAFFGSPGGSTNVAGNVTTNTSPSFTGMTIGSVNGVANDNKTAAVGGDGAHNTLHPVVALNVMVKL